MTQFKCIAKDCTVISTRRLSPASCWDNSRCEWKVLTDEENAAPRPPKASDNVERDECFLDVKVADLSTRLDHSVTLGRNGDVFSEMFRRDLSVSREHCRLERREGSWAVIATSARRCELNGVELSAGQTVSLMTGRSRLLLGDGFEVLLTLSASLNPSAAPDNSSDDGALERLLKGRPL